MVQSCRDLCPATVMPRASPLAATAKRWRRVPERLTIRFRGRGSVRTNGALDGGKLSVVCAGRGNLVGRRVQEVGPWRRELRRSWRRSAALGVGAARCWRCHGAGRRDGPLITQRAGLAFRRGRREKAAHGRHALREGGELARTQARVRNGRGFSIRLHGPLFYHEKVVSALAQSGLSFLRPFASKSLWLRWLKQKELNRKRR